MKRPSIEEARLWVIERNRRNRAFREVSTFNLPDPLQPDSVSPFENKYLDGVSAEEIGDLARKLDVMMGSSRRR
jgi:hypothetical protein